MTRFVLIGLGAILGANARYLIAVWAADRLGTAFPYGTFIANVSGSLMLGFLLAVTTDRVAVSPEMRLLLGVGFLGSYTTFSSYTVESLALFQTGNFWNGLINVFSNNLIGLTCALAGIYLARLIS